MLPRTDRRGRSRRWGPPAAAAVLAWVGLLAACGGGTGDTERFVVPDGATLHAVADTLSAHDIIKWAAGFRVYTRLKGSDDGIKAGTYELQQGLGWSRTLDALVAGRVVTVPVTVPEGWTLGQIAERVAPLTDLRPDSVAERLEDPGLADSLGVPGPTLEGYLFPDTYRFAEGVGPAQVAAEMVRHYHAVWDSARRAALDSSGMSERQAITLASIIQAEARYEEEMPLISAVYHNRLRRGMRLQADPTVQYALDSRKKRLLYADIDSVARHPYNTYTHAGLPPGPIGSPGLAAIDAALHPARVPYLYFVARQDGHHAFSRTLAEHNRAIRRLRRGGPR